jgi:hypothetical protein
MTADRRFHPGIETILPENFHLNFHLNDRTNPPARLTSAARGGPMKPIKNPHRPPTYFRPLQSCCKASDAKFDSARCQCHCQTLAIPRDPEIWNGDYTDTDRADEISVPLPIPSTTGTLKPDEHARTNFLNPQPTPPPRTLARLNCWRSYTFPFLDTLCPRMPLFPN